MSEELDKRLSHTEKAVHELVPVVQQLADSVSTLRQEIKEQGRVLHERIDEHQKLSRPQYSLMVTSLIAILGALIALIVLHTTPIEERTRDNANWITQRSSNLIDDYYQFGQNTARLEDTLAEMDRVQEILHGLLDADAAMAAKVEYLHHWISDVDKGGSRVWNVAKGPTSE